VTVRYVSGSGWDDVSFVIASGFVAAAVGGAVLLAFYPQRVFWLVAVGVVGTGLAVACAVLASGFAPRPLRRSLASARVGRFGVDVAAFEQVGNPALRRAAKGGGLVVIDEIAHGAGVR